MHSKTKNSNPQSAFTIVELLVVIVIIGILATIVIIFYIGTHDKAIDSSLQADLKGASTVLELDKANGDLYPTTKENANDGKGLKSSNGTTLDYVYSSNNSYCLTASKEGRSYYINSEGRVPVQGNCPVGNIASYSSKTWGGIGWDEGNGITQASDGGYVITGDTLSFGAGNSDMFIAKYSADGSLSWSRTWGGTGDDGGNAITQAGDGGYVITGYTESFGAVGSDMLITKYSADGNLSWSRTWVGADTDYGKAITQASDGGYVIAGQTTSFGPGTYGMFITKYSADGNLSWIRTWGGADNDYGLAITQASDGGYVITGATYSFDVGAGDMFIAKYTADGNLSWSRTWGGTGDDWGFAITQTGDGGYAITGVTYGFGAGNSNMFIAKYTAEGNLSWSRTWGGTSYDEGRAIIRTSDGGYAITGYTYSFDVGAGDMFIAKYSADGNLSWSRTWGGADADYGNAITQTGDGGYVIAGQAASFGAGNNDMFIAKYSSDGTMMGCPLSICQSPTATTTIPAATVTSPTATTTIPAATVTSPTATTTNLNLAGLETLITPEAPATPMTLTFSSRELYVAYPGENQTTCKEWTVPSGKTIKGFLLSHETEASYDYFSVLIDDVQKYKQSGNVANKYINISGAPATVLKACMSTDSSTQGGYGGEVTGVVYN